MKGVWNTKWAARKASQRAVSLDGKRCEQCNSTERLQRHHQTYSSSECQILCQACHVKADQVDGFRRTKQSKDCIVCGSSFIPSHTKKHNTCSKACLSIIGRINAQKKMGQTAGRNHRLKALGNAIVPYIAYEIFTAIIHYIQSTHVTTNDT